MNSSPPLSLSLIQAATSHILSTHSHLLSDSNACLDFTLAPEITDLEVVLFLAALHAQSPSPLPSLTRLFFGHSSQACANLTLPTALHVAASLPALQELHLQGCPLIRPQDWLNLPGVKQPSLPLPTAAAMTQTEPPAEVAPPTLPSCATAPPPPPLPTRKFLPIYTPPQAAPAVITDIPPYSPSLPSLSILGYSFDPLSPLSLPSLRFLSLGHRGISDQGLLLLPSIMPALSDVKVPPTNPGTLPRRSEPRVTSAGLQQVQGVAPDLTVTAQHLYTALRV